MLRPLKLLPAFFAVCLVPRLLPAATEVATEVATVESLRADGVTCRRVQLQALTLSVEIDVLVDASRTPGRYAGAECVVLKEAVAPEKLAAADAATADGKTVARRASSTKPNPAFLVLGRELPRAYLAFQFTAPGDTTGTITHRYLLPVDGIGEAPTVQSPEQQDSAAPGPAFLAKPPAAGAGGDPPNPARGGLGSP
jgi:hypothetical protein